MILDDLEITAQSKCYVDGSPPANVIRYNTYNCHNASKNRTTMLCYVPATAQTANIESWLAILQESAKVGDDYCIRLVQHQDQQNYVSVGKRGG